MTHNAYLLPLALLLASCASDELTLPQPQEAAQEEPFSGIVIGGQQAATRALPQLAGTCTADRAKIYIWRHEKGHGLSPSDMTMTGGADSKFQGDFPLVGHIADGAQVSRGTYPFTDATRDYYYTAYAISCLGYNKKDVEDKRYGPHFTVSTPAVGADMTTPTLTINPHQEGGHTYYPTPDLYFGMLNMDYTGSYKIDREDDNNTYGILRFNSHRALGGFTDCNFNIHNDKSVYRIVSQVNLELHNVNTTISRLELVADNVPTQIKLFGRHGGNTYHTSGNDVKAYIYPVEAASQTAVHDYGSGGVGRLPDLAWWTAKDDGITLAYANLDNNVDDNATVVLSSYLLPSTIGRRLYLRVFYRTKKYVEQPDGTFEESFDAIMPIEPLQDAVIPDGPNAKYDNLLDNVDIHTPSTYADPRIYVHPNDNNTFDLGLYIYKASTKQFFSYSNVKLNIVGDYKDLVTATDKAHFTLDVEPAFEQSHHYVAQ